MNDLDISLTPPSPTTLASSSPVNNDRRILLDDENHQNQHEQYKVDQTYDYLPQDYEMTDLDYCAQITIETSLESDILVKIDDIFVISAYICCIKDQAHLESQDGNHITKIVRNYLKHEMVLIPINIKEIHWYLAIINTLKCEIQVLDSLCWDSNRGDLADTLQGLQYHLNIIGRQQNMISHNWKDLQVISWIITEQLQEPMQKDGTHCFITMQLILWTVHAQHKTTPQNISLLGSSDDQKEPKASDSLSEETKYQSLMYVLSKLSENELVGCLCDYIKSINCPETLECCTLHGPLWSYLWVRNSKPYSISLTLRKLQEILNEDMPMDRDCFNLIDVEQLAETVSSWPGVNYILAIIATSHLVHFNALVLTTSILQILIPIVQFNKTFILLILNQDKRTVYILDPTPLDPVYKYNPNARYVKKLLCIAEFLPKAMSKVCPGSRWNEDVFLWRQIILSDVPIENRELSGYLVSLFMCIWKDEELQLPVLKDGYELRKQFMAQLLTYKENECEDNMPAGVRDFLRCINATQS
uniref:Ubiquitin-like protease family profile domain-containing protein n=1 Tax=Setaria viridis TaxID=4556 RepID=A0A4U6V1V5_SETVI|nr:hypothetical protein SEVIR_4G173500v2 [Setaria viridis]